MSDLLIPILSNTYAFKKELSIAMTVFIMHNQTIELE